MKRITFIIIAIMINSILMAQIPAGSFFEYEFTGGSLANTSTSGAPNFTGSINSIADRNGDPNDAADITGSLSGASVGAANVNEMTLSFWMKHGSISSNERILQIYGNNANGFRLQMDGTQLLYNAKAGSGSFNYQNTESENVNITDNAWHHIAIRSTLVGSDTLELDVFLDNVLLPNISNKTVNTATAITNFLMNSTLVVSPTNNYSGDIDDIYFYKSALTDAEITQIYYDNNPCTVNIPDANFKAYLVGNAAINTNGDTEIQCSEASVFNGQINCNTSTISDLTGIETFTALTKLYCYNNLLTSVDISANTALTHMVCYGNQLTSLDLSANTALEYLNYNNNQIPNIDLSNNTVLEYLFCNDNQITSLDLSNNTALLKLACTTNQLTSLDLSANTAIFDMNCSVNQLTSLNLTNNTALTKVYCGDNQITALDVSAQTILGSLFCNNNQLTSLNIANTNNANMLNMFADNNPSLTCIEVDNVAYSNTNWTNIDATANFSTDCSAVLVSSIIVQGSAGASTITTQGGTLQMFATVFPGAADDATYTWSVTNGTGSASIDANGLLTALTDGTVEVVATANDASGVTGSKTITISNQTISAVLVSSINVQAQGGVSNILEGTTLQMLATVLPANADDATYTWSVVNQSGTATISTTGVLTALTGGSVSVRATANDGSGIVGFLTISISTSSVVLVSSIIVQGSAGASTITTNGGTLQMFATVFPGAADDATYTWSVTNGTGSATIDANGLLTALTDGTVEVVATANDASGVAGTKTITISNQSVGINDLAFDQVSVYPNPTNGVLNLKIEEELNSIRIMDISGRTLQVFNPENTLLDISSFTSGIYFLEIANAEKKSIVRIIKK